MRLLVVVVLTLASNSVCRLRRRWSARPLDAALAVTQGLARLLIRALGVEVEVGGSEWRGFAIYVANHRSYTDVPVLMAEKRSVFLAKTEVGEWPLFGTATRLAGTVFVRREEKESRKAALAELCALLELFEALRDLHRRGETAASCSSTPRCFTTWESTSAIRSTTVIRIT
ncbi:MAG: lysophospholipid acyltransferase family protein [Candidatus Binatia bacterium]